MRRLWLLCLCLAGGACASLCLAAPDKPPNVLFILTDNQAASLLGAYGNPEVRTPHVDRLAREGIRFNRAYAVNGMCSPTPRHLDDGPDAVATRRA